MRKHRLPNCPQWLADAKTEDEEVEWDGPLQSRIVWHGGEWHGGEWRGGEWVGGYTAARSRYLPLIGPDKRIVVGCKAKLAEEWIAWLNTAEEFSTPRGTPAFAMIRAHILATITYQRELANHNIGAS